MVKQGNFAGGPGRCGRQAPRSVLLCHVVWCGPCKMIKSFSHPLCDKYSNVFFGVDVDVCQDVAADCQVKCMPTFQFYKRGQKVGEFSGTNKEKLKATITKSA